MSGRRLTLQHEAGGHVPTPREVTDFLFRRFCALGIPGMVSSHTVDLAVLLVRDDFVIWSDGRAIWWLLEDEIITHHISTPEALWRLAHARYLIRPQETGGDSS